MLAIPLRSASLANYMRPVWWYLSTTARQSNGFEEPRRRDCPRDSFDSRRPDHQGGKVLNRKWRK
jgi:hypothetical protein